MKGISMSCMLLLAGFLGSLMAAAPTNIFTNGSYESNPDGTGGVYGWSLSLNGGDSVAATRVVDSTSGTAKAGTNFLKVNVTKVSTQNWHVQLMDPTWMAKIGYVYHFSIWTRADSPRNATISVYGDAASQYTYRTSTQIALTTEWQQFHQIFTSDAEGAGRINFALVLGGAIGTYDFDDAVLTETPAKNDIYQNGSFEADGAGWNLWIKTDSSTAAATMTFPTAAGAKSGDKFCRIAVTSAAANDYEVQLQDGTWACQINYLYTFKLWAKADSIRTIKIAAQAGSARSYGYLDGISLTLSTDWQEFSFPYTSFDLAGSDSLSFVIYCGSAVGVYDLDSISLSGVPDTTMVHNTRGSLTKSARQFAVQLAPEHLRCTMGAAMIVPFKVAVYSVQGRLLSTHSITAAGRSFDLPRPPSGTWIVSVNSDQRNVITIP